jgi:hypothetical protein
VWEREASNTHSFYSVKSVFLFKVIGLQSLNTFNLSGFLRNVAVCSEQLILYSCLFVCQYFVLFSGTVTGFWGVTIMYACHSIIAVDGPRIFFYSLDWTYEFEHHTWHIRMSSLFCVLMYVYSLAVGAYFFRVLSTVLGFTISEFIVHHSRCNKGYPAGLFVNIGMRRMLLVTSYVVWVVICFVYWVSMVVRRVWNRAISLKTPNKL